MKSKTKLIIGLIILVVNFSILMIATYYLTLPEINITAPDDEDNGIIPINTQILIEGNATGIGAHNWSWAVSQPWCSGSGTSYDPFLIEDLNIDGYGYDSCITIKDSDAFFEIRNCTLIKASMAGIALINVRNGFLINNIIYDNSHGILMSESDYNIIFGNTFYNNNYGIWIEYCRHSNISYNNINSNYYVGINFSFSFDIEIHRNEINYNGNAIWQFRNNSTILYDNNLSYSTFVGVVMNFCHLCQVLHNSITYNIELGFYFCQSSLNLVHENNFIENEINAQDYGNNNQWDHNNIGNYWSDYTGADPDDDGIGNSPYSISGSAGSQDNFPIWDDGPG